MPSSCRNCWDTPTTCGLALSYIRRNSVPTTPEYGLTRGLRISSQYLMPMKCTPHHWWATAKRVMLDGVCCRQQNVLHGISRLCHVCRMCSVRTLQASASWGHVTCRTSPHLEQGAPRRAFPFTMIEVTVFGSNEFIKAGRILDRFWHGLIWSKHQAWSYDTRHMDSFITFINIKGKTKCFFNLKKRIRSADINKYNSNHNELHLALNIMLLLLLLQVHHWRVKLIEVRQVFCGIDKVKMIQFRSKLKYGLFF